VSAYFGIAILLAVALLAVGGLYFVARYTAIAAEPVESLPFLCGWVPEEHALSRYHVRWYPLTLLFLAFDVEMLFMYPWALVVAKDGIGAVVEMFVFLGVLLAGVVWAWREGALRWV
jgi:NADH-quinone oxidoreductase subunit A